MWVRSSYSGQKTSAPGIVKNDSVASGMGVMLR